jgi:hypothetical protein
MTKVQGIYDKLLDCCTQFSSPFTTAEVIAVFIRRYQKDWNYLHAEYGKGGKGNGKHYSAIVYLAGMLRRLSNRGQIRRLRKQAAPEGWGYPTIDVYSL